MYCVRITLNRAIGRSMPNHSRLRVDPIGQNQNQRVYTAPSSPLDSLLQNLLQRAVSFRLEKTMYPSNQRSTFCLLAGLIVALAVLAAMKAEVQRPALSYLSERSRNAIDFIATALS